MEILKILGTILAVFFCITGVIYYFNLDMKLIWALTPVMKKHYDEMEIDKRL